MSISMFSFIGLMAASYQRETADPVTPAPGPDHPALALPQGDRPLPAAPGAAIGPAPISHHVRARRTARRRNGGYARRAEARM